MVNFKMFGRKRNGNDEAKENEKRIRENIEKGRLKKEVITAGLKQRQKELIKRAEDREKSRFERKDRQSRARKQLIPSAVRYLERSGRQVSFKRLVPSKKKKTPKFKVSRSKKRRISRPSGQFRESNSFLDFEFN